MYLDSIISALIAVSGAGLFASASGQKARAPREFVGQVAAYALVPRMAVTCVAYVLIALEMLVAVLLLPPRFRSLAAGTGSALLLLYGFGMLVNLWRGRRALDCGCMGPYAVRPIAYWMVWRNGALAVLLACAAVPSAARPWAFTDVVTLLCGIAVMVALYQATDELFGRVLPTAKHLRMQT